MKAAKDVNTATVTALGLIGGWLSARETGVRPLGGVLLGAAGLWAGRTWLERDGVAVASALGALYLAAFALSQPLAKKIGPWPAVLAVTTVASGAACMASDLKR